MGGSHLGLECGHYHNSGRRTEMGDVFIAILAVVITFGSIVFGLFIMFWPLLLLSQLTGARVKTPKKSVEDQMVDAQYKYDRLWPK